MEARDVSGGVQTVGRPQVFINYYAAVIGKLDSLEKIRRGLDADANHDQIGVNFFAGLNLNRFNFAVAGYSRDLRAESEPHSVVLVYLLEYSADCDAEGLLERGLIGRDDRHLEPASLQTGGRFHADETRADDNRAVRLFSGGDDSVRVREAAQRQDVHQIASGDLQGARLAACRHEQRIVCESGAAFERDDFRIRVNLRRLPPAQNLDPMLVEKLVRAERHPFRLGVSLQVIFAQVWAVIRQAIFARDHQNAPSEAFLAQRLRRHVSGRAAAQDHKCAFVLPRIA